ncbi:hypothetical protein EVAR_37345_1 [Eumeta japonica]|uniref:Uncharacterized protein n=1 Tax=Eumeta variegata TaxID=151549 RepID=A0A4C1WZJ8_EUMVA|nr:hypothetical protein EVAR_37345_1 [Eumeta japonica]
MTSPPPIRTNGSGQRRREGAGGGRRRPAPRAPPPSISAHHHFLLTRFQKQYYSRNTPRESSESDTMILIRSNIAKIGRHASEIEYAQIVIGKGGRCSNIVTAIPISHDLASFYEINVEA